MDKVLAPTMLLRWPEMRDLLPEQKLIGMSFWQNPQVTVAGAYFLDLALFATYLGFAQENLAKAIPVFEPKLIVFDRETSEIFIRRWWSFHTADRPGQAAAVRNALNKITSPQILKLAEDSFDQRPRTKKSVDNS